MNIDEALNHDLDCDCEDCMTGTSLALDALKAEVLRLRALTSDVEFGGVAVYRLVGQESERVNVAGLLAEFERLRAENERLSEKPLNEAAVWGNERLANKAAKLEAENAILRGLDKKSDEVREVRDEVIDRLLALEAENAELRERDCRLSTQVEQLREDSADERVEALKAKLARFEDFATVVSVVTARFMVAKGNGSDVIDAVNDLITWEREHPKPEGKDTP